MAKKAAGKKAEAPTANLEARVAALEAILTVWRARLATLQDPVHAHTLRELFAIEETV